MWFVYNVLFLVGYVIVLPYYLWRMWRRGGYRQGFLQRFGMYDTALLQRLRRQPRLWVHAVSVGEVYVALRFIQALRGRRPDLGFVLSTTTSTGHAVAAKRLGTEDVLIYFPLDFPFIVRRVLDRMQPRGLILTEGEIWPNLLRLARGRGIPIAVINGRLSAKSCAGYRRIGFFFRRAIAGVNPICMQSRFEADRMVSLGVDPTHVHTPGSAKYDVAESDGTEHSKAQALLAAAGMPPADPVLLGGSTWPGEETILLDIYQRLKVAFPRLRLVLVPRHAERATQVIPEIESRGLRYALRSALGTGEEPPPSSPEVLLVDTTGELKNLYSAAEVIFVGKSLTAHGGQNIIEPALFGRAILVGPNMENFQGVMEDFRGADALIQVRDAGELEGALRRLLAEPATRQALGRRAAEVLERKRGAIEATCELLLPCYK